MARRYQRLRAGGLSSAAASESCQRERWVVSYADFMTLLMAFFVVMYSVSQVSEQKYRALTETFSEAFNGSVERRVAAADEQEVLPKWDSLPDNFVRISEQLEESFHSLIDHEMVSVVGNEHWLQIELQSAILFDSGRAELHRGAASLIGDLSAVLQQYDNVVRVEGFTDNVPIGTSTFASNWELSAARATAVVRLLVEQGIDPQRLAAIGYGEHQPVASNNSAEGRAKNRRIVLMVSTAQQLRPALESSESVLADSPAESGLQHIPDEGFRAVERVVAEGVQQIELAAGEWLFTSEVY